ncbi:MAG: DUF4845 domain-containing protein [Acidobacteriota bacterium]|nr:DUF4845 domain-containing protein [Acidobacteriota bacterium]
MNTEAVPAWRIAAGALILIALLALAAYLAPVYLRNLKLQQYVEELASRADSPSKPDDVLRSAVMEKANELDLPVKTENVQISRINDAFKISVRYVVRMDLPFYKVDLHFYPGAGSR